MERSGRGHHMGRRRGQSEGSWGVWGPGAGPTLKVRKPPEASGRVAWALLEPEARRVLSAARAHLCERSTSSAKAADARGAGRAERAAVEA